MRSLNLRAQAYPFDWIVSPFDSLYKAIDEDFEFFLTDLKMRADNTGVYDHYGFHFTHDWPKKTSKVNSAENAGLYPEWENALPSILSKYQRRIQRFRNACQGSQKVFFFRTEYVSKEESALLRDLLRKKYPNLDFTLVVAAHSSAFEKSWGLEGIVNFFLAGHDPDQMRRKLKEYIPEFRGNL